MNKESGQDLILGMVDKQRALETALGEMGRYGKAFAKAEQDYRIALAEKILAEREKGTPVTIMSDICRGDRTIAGLRLRRDIGEVMYDTAKESVNVYKLNIKMQDNQIQREWK